MSTMKYIQEDSSPRPGSVFRETEVKNLEKNESQNEFAVVFEGCSWKDKDLMNFYLMVELLGQADVNYALQNA